MHSQDDKRWILIYISYRMTKKKHFSLPTFDGIYVYHLRFISFSEFVFFFVLSVHFKIYDENNKNGIYKNNFAIDIGLVKQLI